LQPFQLSRVPAIRFGPGLCAALGTELAGVGVAAGPVLLMADPGLVRFGFVETAERALAEAGHRPVVFTDITSDPKETQVEAATALARAEQCAAVVALGGGSALDAAKVVASAVGSAGPIERYRLAAEPLPADRLPVVAVPTTAGTGSEATSVSILSASDGTKYWYWSPALKPDLVLLDPALTIGLPPHLTAATGLDAIVHAMEAATNRAAHPAIDHYALAAIRLARENLPRAVSHGDDLDARGAMLLAACYGGVAIDNAGTALAHCAGHALGSLAGIHHGRAVALSMAATFDWIMKGEEARFAGVAGAFGVRAPDLPAAFADFVCALPVEPLPANDERLTARALASRMAAPENRAMRLATAREVGDGDLLEIAERVLAFR
jgi:alcohol dehydrogenase class IV